MTFTTNSNGEPAVLAARDEIDLNQVLLVLRRSWLPLLTLPLLLGGGSYLLASRQPKVYEASTSLMAVAPDSTNTVVRGASVSAPPLPQGAVVEVIHSRQTVSRIATLLGESDLPEALKSIITSSLATELGTEQYRRLQVKARLDQNQRGVYDLSAKAETPEAARLLADAAAAAVLAWDLDRARVGVARARANIQKQKDNISERIRTLPSGSVEQQSLIAARGQLELDLSQATVFEQGVVGSLTLLKEANAPAQPISPRPLRNAALVTLLTFFLTAATALLLNTLRRKVRSGSDLLGLGLPVMGELPRLRSSKRNEVPDAAKGGMLYEPVGFLRVNLESAVPSHPAILAVSSARPGEGKSTVVAAVAMSYAQVGKKVLIVDADLHRPMQHEFWGAVGATRHLLPGASELSQTDLRQAIQHPDRASVVEVAPCVHLLPASMTSRSSSSSILSGPSFSALLKQWSTAYDVVLLDTPPLLALADAFVVARHSQGVILVLESGETSFTDLERVRANFATTSTTLLGVVINKVKRSERRYYSNYSYSQETAR